MVLEVEVFYFFVYVFMVELQIVFDYFVRKGKVFLVEEVVVVCYFEMLVELISVVGYEQYEVFNFVLLGCYVLYNSSYWKGEFYFGIGFFVYSFNGYSWQWNVANNVKYFKVMVIFDLGQVIGLGLFEKEEFSIVDQYNEYVMIGFWIIWGVSLYIIWSWFGVEYVVYFEWEVVCFEVVGQVVFVYGKYWLFGIYCFMVDGIVVDLFW